MKPLARKALIRNKTPWQLDLLQLAWVILLLAGIGNSHSESVYRCGNSYSSSTQCAQENATEVTPHTEPRHHLPTPNATGANEQREADALEKKRLQSERQATQNPPVRVVVVPNPNQTAAPPPMPRYGQRLHRPQSPYFTAKDPNKPVKRTTPD